MSCTELLPCGLLLLCSALHLFAASAPPAIDAEFLRAAGRGDTERVRALLDQGAHIDAKGINGYFALEEAIDHASNDLARLLLERGANVNQSDDFGTTALIAAAKNARTEMIEPLLVRHADVHASQDAAVIAAVGQLSVAILTQLLDAGANPDAKDEEGRSLIMRAIHSPEMTKLLVSHGAKLEPNASDNRGATLLMYAAASCALEPVRMLVARGAELTARDHDGRTLLMNLPLNTLGDPPAHLNEMIAYLVAEGIDPNARDHSGATVLHRAVESHLTEFGGTSPHASVVNALLAAGADPKISNHAGQTPLALIQASNPGTFPDRVAERTKIIALLKKAGGE